jgi:dihydroorotate dehydrogenase subfamily 1
MGLRLKNPVLVAAGPWSGNGELIRKAFLAGAGAVVTESVVNEINIDMRPRIAYRGGGIQNIHLYSDVSLEGWEREIDVAKREGGILIASICAQTASELGYIAKKMEKYGADAIELGLASPMGEGLEVLAANPDIVFRMTRRVVSQVKIPVMVKLSQNTANLSKAARAAEQAGAAAISGIDSIRCILGVDLRSRKPCLPTYGGYSGPPIKPLGLASVAAIAQSVSLPVCGIGGVTNGADVLEYMMLGANVVQMGSALMLHGFSQIETVKRELLDLMREHHIPSLPEIRGAALSGLLPFDEMTVEPKAAQIASCSSRDCDRCVKCCMYGAIRRTEVSVAVDRDKCLGCGLCADVCPDQRIWLRWL